MLCYINIIKLHYIKKSELHYNNLLYINEIVLRYDLSI